MPPVDGYSNSEWAAQGNTLDSQYTPTQLFTAEDDIKTTPALVLTGQNLAVLTIVAFNTANKLVAWAPAAENSTAVPVGILAMDANTTTPSGDRQFEMYVGGCFNPDLLVWPAALDTWLERDAALRVAGAPFRVKRLL
jgi:hypothetical protein